MDYFHVSASARFLSKYVIMKATFVSGCGQSRKN